jgi:hypothetical protein
VGFAPTGALAVGACSLADEVPPAGAKPTPGALATGALAVGACSLAKAPAAKAPGPLATGSLDIPTF